MAKGRAAETLEETVVTPSPRPEDQSRDALADSMGLIAALEYLSSIGQDIVAKGISEGPSES